MPFPCSQSSVFELGVEGLSASCFLEAHNSPRTKKTEVRAQVPLSASLPTQHAVGPGDPRPLLDLGYSHLLQQLLCLLRSTSYRCKQTFGVRGHLWRDSRFLCP